MSKKFGVPIDGMNFPYQNFVYETVASKGNQEIGASWFSGTKLVLQVDAVTQKYLAFEGDSYTKTEINGGLLGNYPTTTATANRVLITDGTGKAQVSNITSTELDYLDNLDTNIKTKFSNIDTAIGNKQDNISAGTTTQYYRGDKSWQTLNTSVVPEGTNLYWTSSRFDTAFSSAFIAKAGVNGGFAPLDSNIKIPVAYLPSYVDDVTDVLSRNDTAPAVGANGTYYINKGSTPQKLYKSNGTAWSEVTPEQDKIYVVIAEGITYRWSGSVFAPLNAGIVISGNVAQDIGTTAEAGSTGAAADAGHKHKLGASCVGTTNIADSAVTTAKIADANVTTGKLADGSVTDAKLAGSITLTKFANISAYKVLGNKNSSTGAVSELAGKDVATIVKNDTDTTKVDLLPLISRYTNNTTLTADANNVFTFSVDTLISNRQFANRPTAIVQANIFDGTNMIPIEVDSVITTGRALTVTFKKTSIAGTPLSSTITAGYLVITVIQ